MISESVVLPKNVSRNCARRVVLSMACRRDTMENRVGSVLYKQAVEADMIMGIAADLIKIDEEDLRKRRAKSVQNVKATNGRLSLEEKVREKEFDDG